MKILQLCLRSPFPPADGGTIAMYNMSMALKKSNAQIKILAFNTKKHFVDPSTFPTQFVNDFNPELVYLDASVRPLPALINLAAGSSYNVSRFKTRLFNDSLEQILDREQFDVIQLESLFMTPYLDTIRKKSKALVILRSHNVEFLIWKRLAASAKNSLKKWYLEILSHRLKNYEAGVINKLDGIIALTEEDRNLYIQLGCKVPVIVSPVGLDTEKYPVNHNRDNPPAVFHLGSMDWLPNIEGIDWFLNYVFPLFRKNSIDLVLHLAGKSMPDRIFKMATGNFHVEGRIDDSKKYLFDKQIMIVPLLSGGGMRVKIIEGLAMGKTIISTTVGAEGIKYDNGRNILIADTPEEFYNAIAKCISDPEFTYNIGNQARLLAEKVYENKVIGSDIMSFYNKLTGPDKQKIVVI